MSCKEITKVVKKRCEGGGAREREGGEGDKEREGGGRKGDG